MPTTKSVLIINYRKKKADRTNIQLNTRNIPTDAGDLYLKAYTTPEQYDTIKTDDIGEMDQICQYCKSYNFIDEKVGDHFSICCQNGKINLTPLSEPSEQIKKLYVGNSTQSVNFKENIRNYNNACAFASMVTKLDPLMDKPGPYFYKVFISNLYIEIF